MTRILSLAALAVALVLTGTAEAKQKKKKTATPTEITAGGTVAGNVTSISDDGKTITVQAPGTKKAPGASNDVKLPEKKDKIEYVGLDDDEKKKLTDDPKNLVGYAVTVTLADGSKDTAASIQVSKATATTPKKKKKKADK
jgi:hypothetical protein